MAKCSYQKLKLLYLMELFLKNTDEAHYITMPQIIQALESYGIRAERKSIYTDIEALRQYGLDIIAEKKDINYYYYIGSRQFELVELKLLMDAVQSAKFITPKKSKELLHKLEQLSSKHQAQQLRKEVSIFQRNKTINESIYYNVDQLHEAIKSDCQIQFQYFQWNVDKEMVLRKNGAFYSVSPFALTWDDENYYLIGFDCESQKMKHYRVDKILHISLCAQKREGKDIFSSFHLAEYAKKVFHMYGGEEQGVTMEVENSLAGVMIDRFGQEVNLQKLNETHCLVYVHVALSPQFIAWVISLGTGVKIIGPEAVVDMMQNRIKELKTQYSLS
ncbi:MAG: WYL domain-containing protein [Anaerotignum sp.]|nr:WYL domain-containing protein [Anaerotignum sp.]